MSEGASVHLRNHDGHTPLYLAADAGLIDNVNLLKESGAHLHTEEMDLARMLKGRLEAGSGCVTPAEGDGEGNSGIKLTLTRPGSSGSTVSSASSLNEQLEERRKRKAKCWELAGA